MAAAATLLDALSATSTNGVGEMYQHLKSILGTDAMQHAESSLQHQIEASVLPSPVPKAGDRGPPKEH
jgi:hypothetical protein